MTLSCAYNASIITWTFHHRGNLKLHHELNCSTGPCFSHFPLNSHALSKRPYRTRVLTLRRTVNRCCPVLSWVHVSCIREESVTLRGYQKHQWNTMMQIHEENPSLCLQRCMDQMFFPWFVHRCDSVASLSRQAKVELLHSTRFQEVAKVQKAEDQTGLQRDWTFGEVKTTWKGVFGKGW